MARYTPELVAYVRDRYENSNDTLAKIAADSGVSERGINRMREREGWRKRTDQRLRDLPQAARLLSEATALLTERGETGAAHAPAPGTNVGTEEPPTPNPSPPFARCHDAGCVNLPAMRTGEVESTAIHRLERLVEKELDAEEAVRAQLGPLPRNPADAERAARTLSTLTQTLHALQRLRSGLSPDIDDDDDGPRDIDEFRCDLARRIRAFVASRTARRDAGGDPAPAAPEIQQGLPDAGACAPGPAGGGE